MKSVKQSIAELSPQDLPQTWDQSFIIYDQGSGHFKKSFLIRARDSHPMDWTTADPSSGAQMARYNSAVNPMARDGIFLLPRVLKDFKEVPFYLGSILERSSDHKRFIVVKNLFSFYLWDLDQKQTTDLNMNIVSKGRLVIFRTIGHLFDTGFLHHYQPEKWPGIA